MQHADEQLKALLDNRVKLYNQIDFIAADPIAIPHRFRNCWVICRSVSMGQ